MVINIIQVDPLFFNFRSYIDLLIFGDPTLFCTEPLFLGGFGAHRFYLGRPGTAILMLILTLTCFGAVISGIWVIIDLIRICTGSLKPANGSNLTN